MAYVLYKGRQFLPLRRIRDRTFTRDIMKKNRQYGVAYYMSSFHTLIVLILLSNFFPTVQGYTYVGVWALALSLVEILVIIPSALGNSMIHKASSSSIDEKRKSFGALLTIIVLIGLVVFINFTTFHTEIIGIV